MNIGKVISIINGAFKLNTTPATPLPPPLIYTGGQLRPGLSPRKVASRIITRQSEAGAPVGALADGSDNISEKMELIRVEEIINALLTEAVVDVVIPPGIPVSTVGVGNVGIPVVSQGTTVNLASGKGIVR